MVRKTFHDVGLIGIPLLYASHAVSISSPKMSSWSWSQAALPVRTGRDPSYPGSQSSSSSGSRRSPARPYMMLTWDGVPATARTSQSTHAAASSR